MTLNEYCEYICNKMWETTTSFFLYDNDGGALESTIKSTNEKMAEQIKLSINIMNNLTQREDMVKLGIYPDAYFDYLDSRHRGIKNMKPQHIWDYIYFNRIMMTNKNDGEIVSHRSITYRQYRRKFKRDKNYKDNDFIRDHINYDEFIKIFLSGYGNEKKDYFIKSMDFYHLEIYKRMDFIYKLATRMEGIGLSDIDKNHFLVKRYTPVIVYPFVENGTLCFGKKHNYYRPLLMPEEELQRRLNHYRSNEFDRMSTDIYLQKLQLIRAKVYELFKYHFKFESDDYYDISSFIRQNYNILSYHKPNKVWLEAKDIGFENADENTKQKLMKVMKNVEAVNDALFWDSESREPVKWTNPKTNQKSK